MTRGEDNGFCERTQLFSTDIYNSFYKGHIDTGFYLHSRLTDQRDSVENVATVSPLFTVPLSRPTSEILCKEVNEGDGKTKSIVVRRRTLISPVLRAC